jgi:BMFP domain-containing protein YqiC
MQTRNPFIDDLTKMANGAMGALTGVKDEVEARIRDQIARILDGMDIPRRDEFDAVKAMAAKAREENEELKNEIAELKAKLGGTTPGQTASGETTPGETHV